MSVPALLLVALLIGPGNPAIWLDLVSMLVLFPALVFLGACSTPYSWERPIAHWMGVISHPIYILHDPLASLFELAWNRAFHHNIDLNAPWGGLLFILVMIGASVLVNNFYDLKVRSQLREKLKPGGEIGA
jgi:peptidoglycan/LPS O-acetylase OafA/YrhL